jgi:TolB-like protein
MKLILKKCAIYLLFQALFINAFYVCEFVHAANQQQPAVIKTMAVMNFDNRSSTGEWQWLGKGLTDMIITDMSASEQLMVVERERLNEIIAEIQLTKAGVVDSSIADQVGHLAKVDWVLFGSFLKEGDHLKIEAHILDLKTQKLLRVEWVEGPAEEVLQLEKRLVQQLLERLDIPITEEERRSIMYVPTDSISAFEHYCRQLDFFDNGQWFDALLECRLAVRDDPMFIKARARLAELYAELDRHEHAVVEYQKLIDTDDENVLPEVVYYRMGRLLEDNLRDDETAAAIYRKVLQRHPEFDDRYDAAVNPPNCEEFLRLEHNLSHVRKIAATYIVSLRTLERMALIKLKEGDDFEAARLYSKIVYFLWENKMARWGGVSWGSLRDRIWERYEPLYQRFLNQNRDSGLCPTLGAFQIPPSGETYDEQKIAEYYPDPHNTYQNMMDFFAPPNKEIAKVSVTINTDTARHANEQRQLKYIQIDFAREPGAHKQVQPNMGWRTIEYEMKAGVRHTRMVIFGVDTHPSVKMELRPWSGPPDMPVFGSFQVNFDPEIAQAVYLDGKLVHKGHIRQGLACTEILPGEHIVEVHWPDGHKASKEFIVKPQERKSIFLSARSHIFGRTAVADQGSHTYMFADRDGKIWLLWDRAVKTYWSMHPSQESDIYYSYSADGLNWEKPRLLPVSSRVLDMKPVMQQDRNGTYWLLWVSSRDPEEPKWLWMASSMDGVKWSFPRKVKLPFTNKYDDISRWRESHVPQFAFAIDQKDNFWVVAQGYLFCSEDADQWIQVELLKTNPEKEPENMWGGKYYFSICDRAGNLFLLNHCFVRVSRTDNPDKTDGQIRIVLWCRDRQGQWKNLGFLDEARTNSGFLCQATPERSVITFSRNAGIFLRTYEDNEGWSENILIESYVKDPMHPSVATLPNGQIVVAYSCKEGIITKLVNLGNK